MPVPIRIFASPQDERVTIGRNVLLRPRDVPKASTPNTVAIAAIVLGVIVVIGGAILFRTIRLRRRAGYQAAADDDGTSTRRRSRMREASGGMGDASSQGAGRDRTAAIDRNTSVRSVMTLPAYRQKAADTEQVLGREGERDGIDIVVEMPSAEDHEVMRDDEMEALYQIRLARRRQLAEREDLRNARREARQRHDVVALEDLRQQARDAAETNTEEVEELRREHERIKDTRQRAVSSVSYAELGVARADGTRLRANSTESERVGLLSDAASIALSVRSPSAAGTSSLLSRRDRASSVLSVDTARSNDRPGSPALTTMDSAYSLHSAGRTRSRANSAATTPRLSGSHTRAGSSPEIIDVEEGDLGESNMPPPGYDDVSLDEITPAPSRESRSGRNSPYQEPPPDYPGPSQARQSRLEAHMEELAADAATGDDSRSTRSKSSIPQLPSLRLNRLPQIVIEPSSAYPRDANP